MSNKAFQSKVSSVAGATQLLLSAGFYKEDKEFAESSVPEAYLVHKMDESGYYYYYVILLFLSKTIFYMIDK